MEKLTTMSQKEIKKYDIIKKLINKEVNSSEAAKLLNLTTRHIRRLKKRVAKEGINALVHGNRGKESNRCIPEEDRNRIVDLIQRDYSDFGPTLATEKLRDTHNIMYGISAIRSIMIKEKIWHPKQRKEEKYHSWRERKDNYGELIQYDGSYEYWFEDRGEKSCLLASIDDATSRVTAKLDKHEGVVPTFDFWRKYIEQFGKPHAIYVDKFSTYSMNHKLAKENFDTLTQFERAMEKDLGIEIITANSPQAKGRVERLFRTFQDRLIKELRLNNISTITEANKFIEEEFLPKFNAKFMVESKRNGDFHKQLNEQEKSKLDSVFSRQSKRVVRNDFVIIHKKQYYQLEKLQPVTIRKKDSVIMEERMDGSIHIKLRDKYLNYRLISELPKKISSLWVIPKKTSYVPPANHPWRKLNKVDFKKNTKISK